MTPRLLSSSSAIRVVATREIRERLRAKSTRWGTLVLVLLAVGLVVLPQFLPDDDDPEWTVAISGATPAAFDDAIESINAVDAATITLERTDLDPEVAAVDDDIDAVLVDGTLLLSDDGVSQRLEALLTTAVAQARLTDELGALGITPEEVAALAGLEPLETRTIEDDDDRSAREGVAAIGTIVLLIAIASYGGWVLTSVLEEKSNRIVEIVVSAIRPSELLAGKVIGVGIVGIAQMIVVLAAAALAVVATGELPGMPDFVPGAVAASLGWFVLGFLFYAVGYAAAGSLTTRQEDAQSTAAPLFVSVMVAYMVSLLWIVPNPDTTVSRVLSLVPPITPLAMPARVASGTVEAWEIVLAIVLMLIAIWLMIRLASRIYTNALLHSGGRMKVLAAFRGR